MDCFDEHGLFIFAKIKGFIDSSQLAEMESFTYIYCESFTIEIYLIRAC
ncbi:MAG: hypothetical protein AABX07_01570 [Nanoarchaeota archaeon]